MKKLLLVLLALFTFTVSVQGAQQEPVKTENISEAERIVDKYGEKIANSFKEAMDTATPMAKEGFKMVVKLQIAKGIAYLLLPLTCIVMFLIYKRNYKIAKEGQYNDWVHNKSGGLALFSLIFSIILFIVSIPATYHGLLHVMVPEWFAIKEIVQLF